MKSTIASIALATLLTAPAYSQETMCPDDFVKYNIGFSDAGNFNVEATFGASSGQFDIYDQQTADRSGSAADFIKNAVEVTPYGNVPLTYVGDGTWKSSRGASETPVTIRYDLVPGHDEYEWPDGKEEIAYRFDENYFFVGRRALLANYNLTSCSPTIAFNLPADWKVAAPWPTSAPHVFQPEDLSRMNVNGFAVGPDLQTFKSTFGDAGEVTFVYEKSVTGVAKLAASDMNKVVDRYTSIFGGAAGSRYMIFMTSDSATDGGAYRDSFAMRFKTPVRTADGIIWRFGFAHETLHLWMGQTIRPADGDIEWFKEGFTDYITAKALYAEGIIDGNDYERKLETMIGRYVMALVSGGPMSLVEAGHNKKQNRMTVYGGGAVVAMMLDAEMAAQNGSGAFEAILADLFAGSGETYTQERLMSVLDAHSDGRASQILAEVDQGLSPFAMADQLDASGIALSVFTPEEMYVTFTGKGCRKRGQPCPPAHLRLP